MQNSKVVLWILAIIFGLNANAQPISTSIPVLLVNDNAQTTAFGEIGTVATEHNYNAAYFQNPALLARNRKVLAGYASYIPWLRSLVPGINIIHAGYVYSPDGINGFSAALNYHSFPKTISLGPGGTTANFRPQEFIVSTRYARAFSEKFSIGLGYKYINSHLFPGGIANVHAGDLGLDYRFRRSVGEKNNMRYNIGAAILNIGQKVDYGASRQDFLPGIIKLGGMASLNIHQDNGNLVTLSLAYQAYKLLVPSPPIRDNMPPHNIIAGRDNYVPVLEGIFGSFTDAPGEPVRDSNGNIVLNPDGKAQIVKGSVLREEFNEVVHQFGFESRFHENGLGMAFAFRAGYFHEAMQKGNRKYITMGIGLQKNRIAIDAAYLIPTVNRHPLANTLLLSLSYQLIGGTP